MVKRTRRPCWQAQTARRDRQVCLAGTRVADQDDRVAVVDPGAVRERGDRGLRDLGVISEPELLQAFEQREPRVEQPSAFASLGAFLISASSSAARYAIGVCCSRVASAAICRNRALTVGSFSSVACASISASSAAVCALLAGAHRSSFRVAGEPVGVLGDGQQLERELARLLRGDQAHGRVHPAAIVDHDHADELAEDPVTVIADLVVLDERVEAVIGAGPLIVPPPGRAAGHSRRCRSVAARRSPASLASISSAAGCGRARAADEQRDGAAVVRAGGQRAADRELDLLGGVLAAEQQHVDHLPGGLLAARALLDRRPQLIEARGPVAAVALLAQRERPRERARLAREQIEVVIELGADLMMAVQPLVAGDLLCRRARS